MADEEINIVHELEVIKDTVTHSSFNFNYGYFGDAVRANVHSALLKIDEVIGWRPQGGGEVDPPEPVTVLGILLGIAGVAAIYTVPSDAEAIIGIVDLEDCITVDDPEFIFEEFDPIEEEEGE